MTPRTLTRMYLIWCHCTPMGWGQSYQSVADAIGVHRQSVVQIAHQMGWQGRFRSEMRADHANGEDAEEIISTLRGMAAE